MWTSQNTIHILAVFVPHSCLLWRGTVLVAGTEFWGYLVRPRRTGTGPQSHRCLLPSGRTALPNPPDVLWHICRGNGLKKAEGQMCHINDLTLCLKHLRLIFSAAHFHTLPHGSNISLWNQINLLLNLISKQGFWLQILISVCVHSKTKTNALSDHAGMQRD